MLAGKEYHNVFKAEQDVQQDCPARPQGRWRAEPTGVGEHDLGPRTPLAVFFNILLRFDFEVTYDRSRFSKRPTCFPVEGDLDASSIPKRQ